MKYNITAGSYSAQIDLMLDNKGGFTGTITHTKYGDGQITDGVQTGPSLKGTATLDGHVADFEAIVSGASISGRVSLNWLLGQDFTGIQVS
jgi:hypothetical protein